MPMTKCSLWLLFPFLVPAASRSIGPMNKIEKKYFMSINPSIGCSKIVASPLCFFYSYYLLQKINKSDVSSLVDQFMSFKISKNYGNLSFYPSSKRLNDGVTLAAFADASHTKGSSQLFLPLESCLRYCPKKINFSHFFGFCIAHIVWPSLHPQPRFFLQVKCLMNWSCLSVSLT